LLITTVIQHLVEEKRVILKGGTKKSLTCIYLMKETIEAEEISELIIECTEQIKAKGEVRKESTSPTCKSQELLLTHNETVRTNSDKDKWGAPVVDMQSRSPPVTANKSLEHYKLPVTLKPKLPQDRAAEM